MADLSLTNVHVIDPETYTVSDPMDLHIIDGKIAAANVERPFGAETIDCEGKFVMPGMIDSHVHLKSRNERLRATDWPDWHPDGPSELVTYSFGRALHSFVRSGVTSVFDAGNDPDVVYGLRRWERAGLVVSPRIHCTGSILTSVNGHGANVGTFVDEDTNLDLLLERHLAYGPDLVKIAYDEHGWGVRSLITILSKEVLKRLIDALHDAGQRVIVHASGEMRSREVLEAGADVLAHGVIQAPVTQEFVELVAEQQVPVVSTLAIGERYFRLVDDPRFVENGMYSICGDPEAGQGAKPPVHGPLDHEIPWADWMRVMTPIAQENLRRLVAAGAVLAAGTDRSFGPDYQRELELLQNGGIPQWEVIRSATRNGAAVLGRDDVGTISPGATADLLVLQRNPVLDVRNLSSIEHVIIGGSITDFTKLDLAINHPG